MNSAADQMSDEELEDAFNSTMGRKRIESHTVDLDSFVKKAGKRKNVDKIYRSYCEAVKKSGSPIEAVSRATFFRRVGEYRSQRKTYSMKTVWNAKEYMQIDLCGDVIILKPDSEGHSATIHVFVAKLPHSGMIYAKALTGCKGVDWNEGIVGAFEYFQGMTDIILCFTDKGATVNLHGKGNKIRPVCVSKQTAKLLESYSIKFLTRAHRSDPFIVNRKGGKIDRDGVTYVVQKYGCLVAENDATFPTKVHCHMLRHSKVMYMLQAGINSSSSGIS